jgi:SRSO17 transposase
MEWPIVAPAPVVTDHAAVFHDLFDNQCQFRHFQHYLTGLIVLPNKSLAHIARCILDSADKTNLSRFLSEAPWREDAVNRRRIRFMLQRTPPIAVAGASRSSSWMIRCVNTWGASLSM